MKKGLTIIITTFCMMMAPMNVLAQEQTVKEDEAKIQRSLSYDGTILNSDGEVSVDAEDEELFSETDLFGYSGRFFANSIDAIKVDNIEWINTEDYSDSLLKNYARSLCNIYGAEYTTETETGADVYSWAADPYTVVLRHITNGDSITIEWLDESDFAKAGINSDKEKYLVIDAKSIKEKSELLSNSGITLTMDDAFYEPGGEWIDINIKAENQSDEPIFARFYQLTINGFQIDTYREDPMPLINAGNSGICTTMIMSSDLQNNNIGFFTEMESTLCILDENEDSIASIPVIIKRDIIGYDKDVIRRVQEMLNYKGYNCGTPDGIAGNNTNNAIIKYQTEAGLDVTGVVDAELIDSLGIN